MWCGDVLCFELEVSLSPSEGVGERRHSTVSYCSCLLCGPGTIYREEIQSWCGKFLGTPPSE